MSLRARLLLLLLLLFTLSWLAVGVATYLEAKHEIEELFDAQLSQLAGTLSELDYTQVEEYAPPHGSLARRVFGHRYEKRISFQIWEDQQLLLRSQSAPENRRIVERDGFGDVHIANGLWRVFSMTTPNGHQVITAENYAVRNELQSEIALSLQVPLALAIPVLMILLWIGVGRSLEPLDLLAREVAARAPGQLEPVDNSRVPAEVKPLTVALNQLLQRIGQALNRERQFTANAAHELRTPLATVRAHAQVAQRALSPQESVEALANVVQAVDRGTRLVEQMLTLARLDPELSHEQFAAVDISALAEAVLADIAPDALDKDIELSLERKPEGDSQAAVIHAYQPGIEIMLRNLLDNAIRHTPGHGSVVLEVERVAGGVLLRVTDTGPGIPESERDRVFDRFYRPAGSAAGGCGLGLSIVARVVELHQGSIRLCTPPGHAGLQAEIRLQASVSQAGGR